MNSLTGKGKSLVAGLGLELHHTSALKIAHLFSLKAVFHTKHLLGAYSSIYWVLSQDPFIYTLNGVNLSINLRT